MKSYQYYIFGITVIVLSGCTHQPSAPEVLKTASEKLSESKIVSYDYLRETNNLFNSTHYTDTAKVIFYKQDSSYHGFGLYAHAKNEEHLFDGSNYEKLKHDEKLRVTFNQDEIQSDSAYFANTSFYGVNPRTLLDSFTFYKTFDTTINSRNYRVFQNEHQQKSHTDSTKIVRYRKLFFIDLNSFDVEQILNVTIRDTDTLQIIQHHFKNYDFESSPLPYFKTARLNAVDYKPINEADEYEEFTWAPIQAGEKLNQQTFESIDSNIVSIYGLPKKSTLIMFSFIGCTPCEIALKDFRKEGYNFKDAVNFYYSSFRDKGSALKKYLAPKEFPFYAFGQESNMIEHFSLYHAPSFVLISEDGTVLKVIEGYDEEIKKMLFEILF